MRLKKLEIYGFKSFAEKTEIVLEHGITGIVGPNGCGKSNISDAVRWVLGEQSARMLRGAKMEDVIFNGTEKRRRLSYCEVSLTFDNEDGGLPLSFGEVCVSRRVYRSGESEYQINRNTCRLRDVVDLFRDTGIGKEGYSLIGQGRIDEILSVRSEDRRQVFEEAAGIVKYRVRKTEAERRLENTRQNLLRLEDILAELSSRIEPLRVQSETAREYLQLRDELKNLEINVFLLRSERYGQCLQELRSLMADLADELADADGERQRLMEERENSQEALARMETATAEMREAVQALIRDVEAHEGAMSVLKERMTADERERTRLTGALTAAQEGSAGIEKRVSELALSINAIEERANSKREELNRLSRTHAEKESLFEKAQARSEELRNDLVERMNRIGDARSEQARLETLKAALADRLRALDEDEDGEEETNRLEEALRRAEQQLEQENVRQRELESRSQDAVERVRILGEETEELAETLNDLGAKKQDLTSRLGVLEEMQRDYEGYQFSVRNVLRRAAQIPQSGVLGVVANLIRVPKELERSIEMALGSALQNIVVEREEDAKRMIDYLRQNRMGRATFLPISAMRGRLLNREERAVLRMPGCVGLASETIEFDERYRGVVENLLGRTVIARDLDAGIRIMRAGRQAFRLVTLEGDVMNPGGSMTGGSVQSRVTSLLSREREIAEHRAKLGEVEQALKEARRRAEELEDERTSLKKLRANLFEQLHQQEIACAREEAHRAAAKTELEACISRCERAQTTREQLETQQREADAALCALSENQIREDGAQQENRRAIAEAQREAVRLRAEALSAQEAENAARVALTALEKDLTAMASERDRLAAQKGDMGTLVAQSEEALAECRRRLADTDEEMREEQQSLQEARARLAERREAFDAADRRRLEEQEAIHAHSAAIDEVRGRIEELTDRSHRAEVQSGRVESELAQMTQRILEDYEMTYETAQPLRDENFRLTDSEKRIAAIRARIRSMGPVNVAAVDEYRETQERHADLSAQRDDLLKAQLDLQGIIDELVGKMESQFRREFAKINENFQTTFVELFGGGKAELRLTDPKDALNTGIEVVAQPPGKKLQLLSLLSGGERALTAIAILFAMLKLKPTPFCFLDEIEAALDDANIDNYAEYLRRFSEKTQFVVVTHRKGTMERCDALYGVSMEEKGVTRLMSIRLREAVAARTAS